MIINSPRTLFDDLFSQLKGIVEEHEGVAIIYLVLEKKLGWRKHHVLVDDPLEINDEAYESVKATINGVAEGKPVQQLLESAEFFGLDFLVNQHVLIPRPETEELVNLVIKDYWDQNIDLLDVGTGTGCIAITLKKNLPNATVHAIDISKRALEVAHVNARDHEMTINFMHLDFIEDSIPIAGIDCLVSNPPYIGKNEKQAMSPNTSYEPEIALFPLGDDPLIFYKVIADKAKVLLKPSGRIYIEINEHYPWETKRLFEEAGYQQVEVFKDLNNKYRMIRAVN